MDNFLILWYNSRKAGHRTGYRSWISQMCLAALRAGDTIQLSMML